MKRNLSLTELTPLTPKETPSLKQRTLSVLLLYELAVITSSVLYLPSLSKDCPDINLYAWNFIFIILTVTHVLAFATENKGLSWYQLVCLELYFHYLNSHPCSSFRNWKPMQFI